jgi:hypothetical protein
MFARKSFFRLKSITMSSDFKWTFDNEVLPLMRRQTGFVGLVMLANPGSLERITISLWKCVDDASRYNAQIYPEVVKILSQTIAGRPKIHTFDEITFTLHNGAGEPDYTQATAAPTNDRAGSSPRSTLSTPSTSA